MNTRERQAKIRAVASRYPRLIEWSDEDGLYVGSAPPLVGQCCHGKTEAGVAAQLAEIVSEWAADIVDGTIKPPPDAVEKNYSGRILLRLSPELHRVTALRAAARGESVNHYISDVLVGTAG
ncbi:MAG: toxin-antitoxin system HicB family antitoxin [Opitutaceae bacterium]|jgi:predicted HicB family RNase H-like nuclease|nr:toxin-antitoxin system HicB family antitoxin [Opitutaceae bacterium]